jgi:hypothetical protein
LKAWAADAHSGALTGEHIRRRVGTPPAPSGKTWDQWRLLLLFAAVQEFMSGYHLLKWTYGDEYNRCTTYLTGNEWFTKRAYLSSGSKWQFRSHSSLLWEQLHMRTIGKQTYSID